jgi:hypothetical protein
MGLMSWQDEFLPRTVELCPEPEALGDAMRKYRGLLPHNLSRHGVMLSGGMLHTRDSVDPKRQVDGETDPIYLNGASCALCQHWHDISCVGQDPPDELACDGCPLCVRREGISCDQPYRTDTRFNITGLVSPWVMLEKHDNPLPMIRLLLSCGATDNVFVTTQHTKLTYELQNAKPYVGRTERKAGGSKGKDKLPPYIVVWNVDDATRQAMVEMGFKAVMQHINGSERFNLPVGWREVLAKSCDDDPYRNRGWKYAEDDGGYSRLVYHRKHGAFVINQPRVSCEYSPGDVLVRSTIAYDRPNSQDNIWTSEWALEASQNGSLAGGDVTAQAEAVRAIVVAECGPYATIQDATRAATNAAIKLGIQDSC